MRCAFPPYALRAEKFLRRALRTSYAAELAGSPPYTSFHFYRVDKGRSKNSSCGTLFPACADPGAEARPTDFF
jgi:hypothetical protein